MSKYKKKAGFRPKRVGFEIDTKFRNGEETYQIKVNNLRRSDLQISTEPAKWVYKRINRKVVLGITRATKQTQFTEIGEVVTMLIFSDKRRLRIYPDDMTRRDFVTLKRLLLDSYK